MLIVTVGCSSDYNENTVIFNNNKYELCKNNFSVYGDYYKSKGYKCFGSNRSPKFLEKSSILFDEGLIYHLADDEYPDVSQSERVEKIKICNENIGKEVDSRYFNDFLEFLLFEELDEELIKKENTNSEYWFVEIYYKDYPAYETTYMIVETNENIGIMCCETARNTSMFGQDNMYVIGGELELYIKSLIK